MTFQRGYGESHIGTGAPLPPDHVWGGPVQITEKEAKRKAFTAFWRGSIFGAILASGAFIASAAMGETISIGRLHINGEAAGATTVSIEPSDEPGQWAVVTFSNEYVNDGGDTGDYTLTLDGVVIGIAFAWDQNPITGADQITVVVPFGLTCEPSDCIATVNEGGVGTVIILDFWGA
jgi:hypothetical protein